MGFIPTLLPRRWFPLAKPQSPQSQEMAFCSDKNTSISNSVKSPLSGNGIFFWQKPGKPLMPRFLLSPFASKRQINTFLIRSDIFVFGRPLTLPIRTLQPRCAAQLGAGWNTNPVGVDCGLIILPRKNYAVATSSTDGAESSVTPD